MSTTMSGISGMSASAGAGLPSIDDVAFAVMALRLQSLDLEIAGRITTQQALIDLRKMVGNRLNELRQELAASGAEEAGDQVRIAQNDKFDYAVRDGKAVQSDSLDNIPTTAGDYHLATKRNVEAEIERLEGIQEGFNSDSEIAMMELNRCVNQRQAAVQMTTNILSADHQTRMGIINNIGK